MTIRTRLTLWYSTLLTTVIIVFALSLFNILNWAYLAQLNENMRTVAEKIEENTELDPFTGHLIVRTLDMPQYYYPYGVMVRDLAKRFVNGSAYFSSADAPLDPDSLDSTSQVSHAVYWNNYHFLTMTYPIRKNGVIVGTIQIASGLWTIDATTDRMLRIMLIVGVVAVLLSFFVGSLIAKQALQPIDAIAHAARQITAADDLSKRIEYTGPPDELGQLTATFNATLGRLERLFNAQRRFVADVSHELRTPLTTIQGNLDLMRRYGNDPESLEAIDSEVRRMARLVGDLLLLAQADAGRLPLHEAPVELGSLALEVYRQSQVLAKEVDLTLGTIHAVLVQGDADRLKQLLLNIVSNAIKYTPAGGKVTINVTHKDGYAFVSVWDTGIGIPKEDLEHIFDRFYRVDKARSRAMGGTGLGLSIAKWIVEAHNGRIIAESEVGKGSTFTIQLPSLDMVEKADSQRETRPRLVVPARLRRKNGPPDGPKIALGDEVKQDEGNIRAKEQSS
ncbi:MAG TPA: ATP-binding protein [Aggregatilineales bacterium]|nr:ATP-binding protein [Aggregatilineales bacterium]